MSDATREFHPVANLFPLITGDDLAHCEQERDDLTALLAKVDLYRDAIRQHREDVFALSHEQWCGEPHALVSERLWPALDFGGVA